MTKHEWNEALAAYDRALPLLKALRAEYEAYLRERYELATRLAEPAVADRAVVQVSPEDGDWGLDADLTGPLADARVQFRVWPVSGHNGATGCLRWGLYLSRELGEGFPPPKEILPRAREAASALPTEPLADPPADVLECGPSDVLRWGKLEIDAPDLAQQLARRIQAAIDAAEAVAQAVLSLRVTTARSWLESILSELRVQNAFDGALAVRGGSWAGMPTLNVKATPEDLSWFAPTADGRLLFQWDKPRRRDAVLARLPELTPLTGRDLGVVLMQAEEVGRVQADDARDRVKSLVLETWGAYRDACSA